MAIVLFDNTNRKALFPLTSTKAVGDLRVGILTGKERWQLRTKEPIFIHTDSYLQDLYSALPDEEHLWIDASVLADDDLVVRIKNLRQGEALADTSGLVACRIYVDAASFDQSKALADCAEICDVDNVIRLQYPWEIFACNDRMLREDFYLITTGRTSESISHRNQLMLDADIFIEEGADVSFATLNSTTGPIYIGKNAAVMEGCVIRGPFAMGEGAVLKMGTKVYGATTIGPYCVAGGEIKNTIMQAYSNKAHDGYLGDSVIGEWCNLGAGTTNSNIKNTGGPVKMYAYNEDDFVAVGQKGGVIMGDYTRTAINTSINTGTVMGVCANVFGSGLSPKFIPAFSWGSGEKNGYNFEKALSDIENWKKLKHKTLTGAEAKVLKHIFDKQ